MRVCALLAVAALLVACGSSGTSTSVRAPAPTPTTTAVARQPPPPRPPPKPPPKPKPRPDPGKLPQTDQLPSAGTHPFHAEMARLWAGVRRNSLRTALAAFFPEAAYVQVKAVGDPRGDFENRLVGDYGLDLAAAHALPGVMGPGARLVAVDVPSGYAHWVPPGVCYNRVGYYEVPNARVVYSQGGVTRSFGIASMISWRGLWYVVHLGSVLRSGAGGMVDDPTTGAGVSAPSSTC